MTYSGGTFDMSHFAHSAQNVASRRAVDTRTSSKVRPTPSVIIETLVNLGVAALRRMAPIRFALHHFEPCRSICTSQYNTRTNTFSSSGGSVGFLACSIPVPLREQRAHHIVPESIRSPKIKLKIYGVRRGTNFGLVKTGLAAGNESHVTPSQPSTGRGAGQ